MPPSIVELNDLSAATPVRWREGCLWLLVIATVRFGIMLVAGQLTHSQHFTDDWRGQLAFLEDPFQILLSHEGKGPGHYPPLQPIVTFLLGYPFSKWLPSFYVIRCFSILVELAAWPMIWALLNGVIPKIRSQRVLAMSYAIAPIAWTSTSLFAQEDSISLFFFSAVTLLAWKGRLRTAILVASTGVVTAKVYFLIQLLALVMAPSLRPSRELFRRVMLAAGPIVIIYSMIAVNLWVQDKPSAILQFTPHGLNSTSIWLLLRRWLHLSADTTKHVSMLTGFLIGVIPLVVAKVRRVRCEGLTLITIMAAMQLFVYMWFYHCDPEYYLIVMPAVLVCFPVMAAVLIGVVGFSLPFAINLFYGVHRAQSVDVGAGKGAFVNLYHRLIPFDPGAMHTISLVVMCAFSIFITCWLTRMVARSPKLSSQERPTTVRPK